MTGRRATGRGTTTPTSSSGLRDAETELDSDKRHELYNQIQAQVNEDAPFIFLYYLPDTTVFQSYVKGFNVLPTGNWRMEDVWLDK